MGFNNPIVGRDTLIREAIKSENYIAGVSGWAIFRNGDAEFNGVILRSDLDVQGLDGSFVRVLTNGTHADILLKPQDDPTTGNSFNPGIISATLDPAGGDFPVLIIKGPWLNGPASTPPTLAPFSEPPTILMYGPNSISDINQITILTQTLEIGNTVLSAAPQTTTVHGDLIVDTGDLSVIKTAHLANVTNGTVTIVPSAANTPTNSTVSGLGLTTGLVYTALATAQSGANPTTTGVKGLTINTTPTASTLVLTLTRGDTTGTVCHYQVWGS